MRGAISIADQVAGDLANNIAHGARWYDATTVLKGLGCNLSLSKCRQVMCSVIWPSRASPVFIQFQLRLLFCREPCMLCEKKASDNVRPDELDSTQQIWPKLLSHAPKGGSREQIHLQ